MARICVRLAPFPHVFRHPVLCWPCKGDAIRLSLLTAYWRRSYYQGGIITAIAVGQPSRILRPMRLPSPGPLASEPAEIQGPLKKRYLGLQHFAAETKKPVQGFTPEVHARFLAYPWPGNVRELANVIERAVVLGEGPEVTLENLPLDLIDVLTPRVEAPSSLAAPPLQAPSVS